MDEVFRLILAGELAAQDYLLRGEFSEEDHPRDGDGKFTDGDGGHTGPLDVSHPDVKPMTDAIRKLNAAAGKLEKGTKEHDENRAAVAKLRESRKAKWEGTAKAAVAANGGDPTFGKAATKVEAPTVPALTAKVQAGSAAAKEERKEAWKAATPPVPVTASSEAQKKWEQGLSKEQRHGIDMWASLAHDSFQAYEEGKPYKYFKWQKAADDFFSAIKTAPPFEGTTFRGLHNVSPDAFKVGSEYQLSHSTSSSEDLSIAHTYANNEKNKGDKISVVIETAVKNGAKLGDSITGGLRQQEEVILRKDTRYRVDKVEERTGTYKGKPFTYRHVTVSQLKRTS